MNKLALVVVAIAMISCDAEKEKALQETNDIPIEGTWKLISGTLIEKEDTVTTDYTQGQEMLKIINASHFAFLRHDLDKNDDTSFYSSGGGSYMLKDNQYTENLVYCSDRDWEGHQFQFTVSVVNDTLVQTGVEKLEDLGIERLNIEKYVRVKK